MNLNIKELLKKFKEVDVVKEKHTFAYDIQYIYMQMRMEVNLVVGLGLANSSR